jgi:protein-tyrosine phosphatase
MIEQHSTFRQELERACAFGAQTRDAAAADVSPAVHPQGKVAEHLLQRVAVAFEDIPEDLHSVVKTMLMRPTDSPNQRSLREHVDEVVRNVGGASLGELEMVSEQLSKLHILACLHHHMPYTYKVDDKLIRGARPTAEKLRALHDAGCTTTVNLCEEMLEGDDEVLKAAGLSPDECKHIGITDNTPPGPEKVQEFIETVRNAPGRVYVHCEAGVGRTGVMVACYRLSEKQWHLKDAYLEAQNFGCSMPDQLASIERWAADHRPAGAFGVATDEQLRQTASLHRDPIGLQRALA